MGRGLLCAGAQQQGGPGRSHRKATWSKDLIQRKNPQAAGSPGPESRRMTEAGVGGSELFIGQEGPRPAGHRYR